MTKSDTTRAPAWQVYVYYKAPSDQLDRWVALSGQVFDQIAAGPWAGKVLCHLMRRADTAEGGPVTLMEIYTPKAGSESISSRVSFLHDFKALTNSIWKTLEYSPIRMVEVFESLSAPTVEDSQCA